MIGIKKAVLKNKTMDVLSMVEFDALYNRARSTEDLQSITQDVCVQVGDYVYPVTLTPKTGSGVWMYANDAINVFHDPETEEEKEEYSAKHVIDLSSDSVKDLKDNIMAMDKLKNAEISRLSMIKSVLELILIHIKLSFHPTLISIMI